MLFKILTVILTILLSVETGYMLTHRRPNNRFQSVSGYDGVVALDTRGGRLCRTLPGELRPATGNESGEEATVRALPTCWSIR
jgi:hypothetical protein